MPEAIEDYALIGDTQTAALVGRTGSIDWLCFPRFDSGACFAALLGDERHGRWRLAPDGEPVCTRRRYRPDTLVLETEWETAGGSVRVIDFMPPRGAAPDVVRIVEGIEGRVKMVGELRLRFDYGRIVPWLRHAGGELGAVAGPDAVWLRSPVQPEGRDLATYHSFEVGPGDRVPFVLTWQASHLARPDAVDPEQALRDTESFWAEWVAGCRYDGEWRDAVVRSLITLKALTYAPTGGICAAVTCSLPESPGGARNWDYRYCWLRDATFTLQALLFSGYTDEARAWRNWLLRAVAGDPRDLQILYGLSGERRVTEYQADWLPGYQGAAPVRIGNAAVDQFQLDVWGEVLDGLSQARRHGVGADDDSWDLQQALVRFLEENWDRPDDSLWEIRGEARHFVHSKVMAWAGVDRAVRAVEEHGLDGPVDRWRALRDRIHADVCEHGFDRARNTFTQYYGSTALDAALLLIPQVGFLPPDDERVIGTVEAVQRELLVDGYLLRYDTASAVDGLSGTEGAFVTCTFWLVDALAMIGREHEAREMFERLLGVANDVGLLAEEYDPRTGRQLGNTPQGYSHVAVVNSARALTRTGRFARQPVAVRR